MTAAPDLDLSVLETAELVGVSRSRVYQRIDGYPADKAGRALTAIVRETNQPGTRRGRQKRVALADALAWRRERIAAGLPVGPLPRSLASLA